MGVVADTSAACGMIFDIQRFSVHDGPGIRTTVFLKGCPLRCLWCHNPESISKDPVLLFTPTLCIGCGACAAACPTGAITGASRAAATGEGISPVGDFASADERDRIDRTRCRVCGACAHVCPSRALEIAGRAASVADVMKEVEADIPFYKRSGGGVTISGGEPLAQPGFVHALLEHAKEVLGVDTALDTSGFAQFRLFELVLPFTDRILYDVKHMDSARHKALTGVPNELILENLARLSQLGVKIEVRVPVIPGCNDDEQNISETKRFVASLPNRPEVRFLPYHALAESKYLRLGIPYPMKEARPV